MAYDQIGDSKSTLLVTPLNVWSYNRVDFDFITIRCIWLLCWCTTSERIKELVHFSIIHLRSLFRTKFDMVNTVKSSRTLQLTQTQKSSEKMSPLCVVALLSRCPPSSVIRPVIVVTRERSHAQPNAHSALHPSWALLYWFVHNHKINLHCFEARVVQLCAIVIVEQPSRLRPFIWKPQSIRPSHSRHKRQKYRYVLLFSVYKL